MWISLLGLGLSLLISCTTKTYYLRSDDNGFGDTKISDTSYTVVVKSKNVEDKKRLQDIFYLRAAEIAKENGYPFFYTVESFQALAEMNPEAKPFSQRILSLVFYQTLTISGVVRLLEEVPEEPLFQVFSTEQAYRQRGYLIVEKENIFGKTSTVPSEDEVNPANTND